MFCPVSLLPDIVHSTVHVAGEYGRKHEIPKKSPNSYQTALVLKTNQKGLGVCSIIGQLLELPD